VTGFKWGVLRQVTQIDVVGGTRTDRFAGLTLMFEPARFSGVAPWRTETRDPAKLEGFVAAIERTPAYEMATSQKPMGVVLQSGGLR
jgi:hypothetical protein